MSLHKVNISMSSGPFQYRLPLANIIKIPGTACDMKILLILIQILFYIVATCPELMLDNGDVNYNLSPNSLDPNMGYSENTTASYQCDPGFEITGTTISVCSGQLEEDVLISVEWSPETPRCQRKQYRSL